MTISVYIFGNLGNGYTQYPDDYAKTIYQNFYEKSTAASQITIHRDNNLMYYGYIRKLDVGSQYIGFCVLLNGIMFSNIGRLFPIFENAVADLVARGEILHFNDRGDITSSINNLNEKQQEVARIVSIIQSQISDLENSVRKLPPINYGISNKESKTFSESDKNEEIVNASCKYGYTYILKDKDYDTISLRGYKSVLIRLNEEKDNLVNNYNELKNEYDKLTEQKKQYKKVVTLCILVVLCGVGLFFLNGSLNSTKGELSRAWTQIENLNEEVEDLEEKLEDTKASLKIACEERDEARREKNNLKNKVSSVMPIIITDIQVANTSYGGDIETDYGYTIYSNNTMYLKPKITYTGIKTGENIDLEVKFYTPSGLSTGSNSPYGCSYSTSIYVYSGENTESLSGWGGSSRGHWGKGTYRFEIWYGSVCLNSKTFTIY